MGICGGCTFMLDPVFCFCFVFTARSCGSESPPSTQRGGARESTGRTGSRAAEGFDMEWRSPSGNDTPEHEGKGTWFARNGKRGRPSRVVVGHGRPRDASMPTLEDLADPAVYARFKKRLQSAVFVAEERKALVAHLRERLQAKQAELEQTLRAASSLTSPSGSLVMVEPHVAEYIDSLAMGHIGVSAQKMALLNALMSFKFRGAVSEKDIRATTTYAGLMRTGGSAIQQEVIMAMQKARFCFIQNDESGRGGVQLSSTTVSYCDGDDLKPKVALLALDILPQKDAATIARSVSAAIDLAAVTPAADEADALVDLAQLSVDVAAHGVVVAGFGSDNAATMCGKRAGVGALLSSQLGRYLRHDTCLEHVHALLLATFSQIFGDAVMNEISVAQWLYLCWYVCNKDWALIRGLMVQHLAANPGLVGVGLDALDEELDPSIVVEADEAERKGPRVTKCDQPHWFRWGSVAQAARWVKQWLPVVLLAFCDAYNFASETPAGSLAAMAKQFVQWSQSTQLRAQFAVLLDWIELLLPFEKELRFDTIHGFGNVFRGSFALDWYRRVDAALDQWKSSPQSFASFAVLAAAYPDNDMTHVWKQLAELALDCLERNLLNVWGGLFALGAFADPVMAAYVFEALMHVIGDENAPNQRTPVGLELQEWFLHPSIVDEQHRAAFYELVTPEFRRGLVRLYGVLLVQGRDAFVAAFTERSDCIVVCYFQQQVFPVVNVMTRTERTFAGVDYVSRHHQLLVKRDAASPAQGNGRVDTTDSLVKIHYKASAVVSDCSRAYQEENDLDWTRLSQAKSVAIAAATALVDKAPTEEVWKEAKKSRSGQRNMWRRSGGGLSGSDQRAVDGLLEGGVKRRAPLLLDTADEITVPINGFCFHDGQCLHGRRKTRGKQAFFECKACNVQFHKSCIEAAGLSTVPFYCCQTEDCNRPANDRGNVEVAAADGDDEVDDDEVTPISRKQRTRKSTTASQGKKRGR